MTIFQRISKLISANVNNMLDTAEDPEVMVKQLIRDMEESIIELRRETVKAIGAQKQLEKKIEMSKGQAATLEKQATNALEKGDDEFARQLLTKKFEVDSNIALLEKERDIAMELAEKMKDSLGKLEDQAQTARRKKEELIRRKLVADAKKRTQASMRKSHEAMSIMAGSIGDLDSIKALESYEEKILQMEAEAEASEELLKMENEEKLKAIELEKTLKKKAVEDALADLKKKLDSGSGS